MDLISRSYRKPKGRPSKRRAACKANFAKRNCVDSSASGSQDKNLEIDCRPSTSQLSDNPDYMMMSSKMWSSLLADQPCVNCGLHSLDATTNFVYGFSANISLMCQDCGHISGRTFSSCRETISRKFDINSTLVKAFLAIGKGHAALEIFSMILGVPAMDRKTFANYMDALAVNMGETKQTILEISRKTIRERFGEEDPSISDAVLDVCVSYDGTWHKRGHTSLYGIGLIIEVVTGLVLDYEIMSKYCPECVQAARDLGAASPEYDIWYSGHKNKCQKNFTGSSNSMEMYAAEIIWKRSVDLKNFRYISMLSDGDSKTYQHIKDLKTYGDDVDITKQECLNHVAKRLGKALHNKVREWKVKGVTLGGKKRGNLTEDIIRRLQNYYHKAIKVNAPDVDKMKTAILASLYHSMSTDSKPAHNKCPTGISSWCFYQRAIAKKIKPPKHSTMKTCISEKVVEKILPVYQRLMSTELLTRCAHAAIQNANESLHSCIWQKCPKEVFVSKKRLELAVVSAVCEYNFGLKKSLEILKGESDNNCISLSIAEKRDCRRYSQKAIRSTEQYKAKRNIKKYSKASKNSKKLKEEGPTYGCGDF